MNIWEVVWWERGERRNFLFSDEGRAIEYAESVRESLPNSGVLVRGRFLC